MSGQSSFTAQLEAKKALVAAAKVALEGDDKVDIYFGFQWPIIEDAWFAVTSTASEIDPANIGPRRGQDETITIGVSIGAWVSGADEAAEIEATERAFSLLRRVWEHIRTNDVTLGDTVLWCMPGSFTSDTTPPEDAESGRTTEIAGEFVCAHRIRT